MTTNNGFILSIDDVYGVITDHMQKLDVLWPDNLPPGSGEIPNKIHVIELLDAMKLRMAQVAERNTHRHETAFERAAKKITGGNKPISKPAPEPEASKTATQMAYEAAKARMKQ